MNDGIAGYYAASRREAFAGDPFDAGRRFDVVVVGGGLTGLNAALELARRGVAVCVLERHAVGWGASGRSGGQIIAGPGCDMIALERSLGRAAARELWALCLAGMAELRERIARHRIDCDLADGHLQAAHNPREADRLRREADHLASNYDYPVRYLDRTSLAQQVSTNVYDGGLYDPASGHLHPLNYTLAVARIAREAGALVCEGVDATAIEGNGPHRVHTARGVVDCDTVLLAANAYLDALEPTLSRHFVPVGSHIAATEPLGADVVASLLPGRAAVSDTRRVLDYYRPSGDHRLLFGGRIGALEPSPDALAGALKARILRVFPSLADAAIEFAWGGHVAVTRSHMPHLGRLRGSVFHAQGYSGHGMVLSGVAGRVLAEAATGALAGIDLFARIDNPPLPLPRVLLTPALALMIAWYRLLDRL